MTVTISMSLMVCPRCGCTYGVPEQLANYRCPSCAGRAIEELNEEMVQLNDHIMERDRSIAALKGALTKAKRR